jgi:hypothetical protein
VVIASLCLTREGKYFESNKLPWDLGDLIPRRRDPMVHTLHSYSPRDTLGRSERQSKMSTVEEHASTSDASTSQLTSSATNGSSHVDTPSRTGNRKGGRGGARQDASPTIQLSKALSYILRHGAAKEGLKVRPDGYIPLSAVLARPKVSKLKLEHGGSPTEEDVLVIVDSNDKKRFEVTRDEDMNLLIRAVQGHSITEVSEYLAFPLERSLV